MKNYDAGRSPELTLFMAFKQRYDPKGMLSQPSSDISIADLWKTLGLQFRLKKHALAEKIAQLSGHEVAQNLMSAPAELVTKLPVKAARQLCMVPIRQDGSELVFAVANPLNPAIEQNIRFIYRGRFKIEVAPPEDIETAIEGAQQRIEKAGAGKNASFSIDGQPGGKSSHEESVPALARQLLARSIENRATDLHLHPYVGGFIARVRVDGMLQRLMILPDKTSGALIRFFKSHGGMDSTNSLVPQDGQMKISLAGAEYELRLSVLPVKGRKEKLVIRFIYGQTLLKLSQLGLSHDERRRLRAMTKNPSGVILICGPTGSGKSTTLYSVLAELNQPEVSICTVENPVENTVPGLSQTEVNEKAGMTFAGALRSILRQDPDVILIGEIRDSETARTALQAALTGHLVLSTLHTNDAYGAFSRLLDLDIDRSVLTDALTGVLSQRLVRRLCAQCSEPVQGALNPVEDAFKALTGIRPGRRAVGCEHCSFTGYRGRTVITEMFALNAAQRSLLRSGVNHVDQLRAAGDANFHSISFSAASKVISGDTTVEEAYRVIGQHFWLQLAEDYQKKLPDLGAILDMQKIAGGDQPEIIVAGATEQVPASLIKILEEAWYTVHWADSPEKAREMLEDNEQIFFGILELPSGLNDQEAVDYVESYRSTWARTNLPALIRLPAGRESLERMLKGLGHYSRYMRQDAPAEDLLQLVTEAQKKNLDINWGLTVDMSEAG